MIDKVFISYRRDDSAGYAGRIHDRLEREFGRDLLFMDVDSIPLGLDFARVLEEAVAKCDVLLAIVGPDWLHAKDIGGNRRLDNCEDFVRLEIAAALSRDIPVVPILLDTTEMPAKDVLPSDLQELSRRNALTVRHSTFHSDMDTLISQLRNQEMRVQNHRSEASRTPERLDEINRLIDNFFQPIKSRLEKDNAIWRRIIRDKDKQGSPEYKMAAAVEREHVLPNHDEIILIIDKWRHLVDDDEELCSMLNAYMDHVIVFKSIRSAGDDWTYPELMGSPWPKELYPLIKGRLGILMSERATLMANQ